jgi:hypothetical protein
MKLIQSVKANSVLGICIALILYVSNGIRLSIANSEISSWSLTELLINYQGGFVRRGIFGEIVFNTSNPIYFATLFQKFALLFVLIGIIAILCFESSNISRILFTATIIFAPGGIHDMKSGGNFTGGEWEYLDRKEIWFYGGIICFYFIVKFLNNRPLILSITFSLISVVLILHHEVFFVFSVIIYTLILLSKKSEFRSIKTVAAAVYYLLVSITFFLVTSFSGNSVVAYIIWYSYQEKYSSKVTDFGAIGAINWTIADSHNLATTIISQGSVLYYIYFAALSILFLLLYTVATFKIKTDFYLAIVLNGGIFLGCLMISYVFLDVGRLISIYTIVTLLALSVLRESLHKSAMQGQLRFNKEQPLSELFQKNFVIIFLVSYLIFVTLITRVNHCCPQPNEIPLRGFFGLK